MSWTLPRPSPSLLSLRTVAGVHRTSDARQVNVVVDTIRSEDRLLAIDLLLRGVSIVRLSGVALDVLFRLLVG